MGRIGVSKRKPILKSKPVSKANISGGLASDNARPAESMPATSVVVRGREALLSKGGTNPSTRSTKTQKNR